MLKKAKAQCKLVYKGRSPELLQLIDQIDRWQLALIAPKNFDSNDVENYIKKIELSFETLCASLEDLGVRDPGSLTVFQFYSRLLYFEKKKQKQARQK